MAKLLSNTRVYGTATVDTQLLIRGFLNANSTSTGALQVSGGIGVSGGGFFGGTVTATNFVGSISGSASNANNINGGTAGQLVYQSAPSTTGFVGPGNSGELLISQGTSSPIYVNTTTFAVGLAKNLLGGAANQFAYQTAANTTNFATTGSMYVGRAVLADALSTGAASTATNLAGGTAGQVPYQTAPGLTSFFGPGTSGQILVSAGAAAPVYTNTSSIYVKDSDFANDIRGGVSGQFLYQVSANNTDFISTASMYVGRAVLADTASSTGAADTVKTVARTDNINHYLVFVDSNNATATAENLYTTSTVAVNASTGNMGLGTASPSEKLELLGPANTARIKITNSSLNRSSLLAHDSSGFYWKPTNNGDVFQLREASDTAIFTLNPNTQLIGIGTTGPSTKLHVDGSSDTRIRVSATDGAFYRGFEVFAGSGLKGGMYYRSTEGNVLQLWGPNNSVGAMYIDANNNVGIANTVPDAALTVGVNVGSNNTDYGIKVARHGTAAVPGTWSTTIPAINIVDWSGDGPTSVETSALLMINCGRMATTDTYAKNASIIAVGYDSGADSPLRLDGAGNLWIGWNRSTLLTNNGTMSLLVRNGVNIGTNYQTVTAPSNGLAVEGNIGAGTSSPAAKIHAAGTSNHIAITSSWSNGTNDIIFSGSSTPNGGASSTAARIRVVSSSNAGAALGDMLFTVNAGDSFRDAMYISTTGNVGIGTTSPSVLYTPGLHIYGSNPSLKLEGSSTSAWEFLHLKQPSYERLVGMRTNGNFVINNGTNLDANNELVVKWGGNVGVSNSDPQAKLHITGSGEIIRVESSSGQGRYIRFNDSSGVKLNWIAGTQQTMDNGFEITPSTTNGGSTFTTPALVINSSSNTGIGTASPGFRLDVSGTARATSDFRAPIFYDTDNTNFYADPASTSVFNALTVTGRQVYGRSEGFLTVQPSTNYSGWVRIARSGLAAGANGLRGGAKVYIAGTGGSIGPSQDTVTIYKNWTTSAIIGTVEDFLGSYFNAFRLTMDADYVYLEGQLASTINIGANPASSFAVAVESYGHNVNQWTAYNENLTAGLSSPVATYTLNTISNGISTPNLYSAGNLSVGTTSPLRQVAISRATETTAEQLEFRIEGGITTGNYGGIVWTQGSAGATTLASMRLNYNSSGAPDIAFNLRNESNVLFLRNGGNVGINTASPTSKFQVNNNGGTGSAFYVDIGDPSTAITLFEHTGANTPVTFRLRKSGYSGNSINYGLLYLHMNHNTTGGGSNLYFTLNDSAGNEHEYGGLGAVIRSNTNGSEAGDLFFMTSDAGSTRSEKMRIRSDGNVGIGTTDPAATLHVNASGGGLIRASRSSVSSEYIQMEHDGTNGTIAVSGANTLILRTNSLVRARITGAGAFLVGTDSDPTGGTTQHFFSHSGSNATAVIIGDAANTGSITGLYLRSTDPRLVRPTNIPIHIADTSGTKHLTVLGTNNDGRVGLGTDSPSYKLHVTTAAMTAAAISTGWPAYNAETAAQSKTLLYLDGGGNGGVSTAGQGPSAVLLFGNYYDSRGIITPTGAGGASPSDQGTGRGKDLMVKAGNSDNTNGYVGGRLFIAGGSGYSAGAYNSLYGSVIIQSQGGNVGIGTVTPQKKLDVNGGSGIVASFGGTISPGSFSGFHFGYSETNLGNDAYKKSALVFERTDNNNQGGNASGKIHFLLNNSGSTSATSLNDAVVTIDSDANGTVGSVRMGIQTRNPIAPLTFLNNAQTRKIVLWWDGSNNNDYRFYGFGIEGSTLVYSVFDAGDNHVFFAGLGNSSRRELMRIAGSGNVTVAGTVTENSSITIKENLNPITNALNIVSNLKGYTYDRKDGTAKKRAGLVAEEVEKVLPNVVAKDAEGNPSGIQYTNLIAYLIESIKELKQEIEELKNK